MVNKVELQYICIKKFEGKQWMKVCHEKVWTNCIVDIPSLNIINIMTYRPLRTELEKFNEIQTKLQEILKGLKKNPEPTVDNFYSFVIPNQNIHSYT